MRVGLTTSIATAIAIGVLVASGGGPSPPSVHVWVTTTGSDVTCVRDNQSLPCATFDKAFDIAQTGDAIEVADGSYTSDQIVTDVQKAVTIQAASGAQPRVSGLLFIQCTTGVTFNNIDAKVINLDSGNDNLTINGGEYGNGTYTIDNAEDPVGIGGTTACSTGTLSNNVTLDGIYVHDYFWNQDPGTAHPDCMQFGGNSDGVTIRNATFLRCSESFVGLYPDFGNITNVLIEDSTFNDISGVGKGSYWMASFANVGGAFTCTNITLRSTVWAPGAYLGVEGNGLSMQADCGGWLAENNTLDYGIGDFACDTYYAAYGPNYIWRNNTYINDQECVTP